jgi:hypothetical protein
MQNMTQQEISDARGKRGEPDSIKTVQRDLAAFNVRPVDVRGRLRFYAPEDVEQMEAKKKAAALAAAGGKPGGVELPAMKHLRTVRSTAARKAVRA